MPATATFGPTTATVLGAAMLGEQLRGGWAVPVEVVFFGLLLVGVARLASSPVLDDAPASDVDGSGVVDAEHLERPAQSHVDGDAHREVEHLGIAED